MVQLKTEFLQNSTFDDSLKIEFYKTAFASSNSGFFIYDVSNKSIFISDELLSICSKDNPDDFLLNNKFFNQNILDDIILQFNILTKDTPTAELTHLIDETNELNNKNIRYRVSLIQTQKYYLCQIIIENEKIQFEIELAKAKEKIEESNKIKTTFLSNISHEIRTPMNTIIGFTELLNIGEISIEKRQEYLSIIKNKSKQLLSLIDDIAELSKFESGELLLNKSETNLSKFFNDLHTEYEKELKLRNKQNIELYLKLPTEQNITTIHADSGRLHQILNYLLDNALKFTEKGYIQFGYEMKDQRNLQFFVKDTGIGISKEAQKYLFNRFHIKEESYDKNAQNTGLGLTLSRAIVDLFGGKISVESSPGNGTTFYFTIPIPKTDKNLAKSPEENNVLPTNWRNKIILIAEDDDINYHFLEAVFADSQAQLIHVNDGVQAIDICHKIAKIDLILMDIKMPEKSGYEAIQEIKKFRKDIPIIVQTAYTQKEDKEKSFAVGCNDYITKPIDIERLLSLMRVWLSQ